MTFTEDRKEWRALVHMYVIKINATTLLSSCVIWIVFPRSNVLPPVRGRRLLHDAVVRNCEKGPIIITNIIITIIIIIIMYLHTQVELKLCYLLLEIHQLIMKNWANNLTN